MNESRAEELRQIFNRLEDDHRLSLIEVELIPAVLGQSASWSYSSTDGTLLWAKAYDQDIETVGDLRRIAAEHPLTREADSGTQLADNIAMALGAALLPLRREIVFSRMRVRALLNLMAESDPTFTVRYDNLLRDIFERDAIAMEHKLFMNPDEYSEKFKTWIQEEEAREVAIFGDSLQAHREGWERVFERLNTKLEAMRSEQSGN